MYTVYILYSESIGGYYVGYTSGNVSDRLSKHLSEHKGYTSKAKDWKIVRTIEFAEKREAVLEERRIKWQFLIALIVNPCGQVLSNSIRHMSVCDGNILSRTDVTGRD